MALIVHRFNQKIINDQLNFYKNLFSKRNPPKIFHRKWVAFEGELQIPRAILEDPDQARLVCLFYIFCAEPQVLNGYQKRGDSIGKGLILFPKYTGDLVIELILILTMLFSIELING